jgi:hypothetical protein
VHVQHLLHGLAGDADLLADDLLAVVVMRRFTMCRDTWYASAMVISGQRVVSGLSVWRARRASYSAFPCSSILA